MKVTLRTASWVIGGIAVVLPGAYMVGEVIAFNRWAAQQHQAVCGTPLVFIWLVAGSGCALLSILAATLNGANLLRNARPIPWRRRLELAALAAPAIACVAMIVATCLD
jgi:hypothetical protein